MSLDVQRPVGFDAVEVAPDTFLIRTALAARGDAMVMYQSSMVIRGAQPILVDTGPAAAADLWLDATFGVVDPEDVRWIFVSHNDTDHDGNLIAALAACPNATLVTTSAAVSRMTSSFDLPYRRMSWLDFGDTIDAGDRTIEVIDPPVYDSPTTQGLFDRSTGALWAVDAFAAPVPADDAPTFAHELPADAWEHTLAALGISANPWLEGVRPEWFAARLAALADRRPTVIASAHGPAIHEQSVARAVEIYAALPGSSPPKGPGAAELDALLRAHHP